MPFLIHLLIFGVLFCGTPSEGNNATYENKTSVFATQTDMDNLIQDLLQNYSILSRGKYNQSEPIEIYTNFFPININDFDEITGTFSANGFLQMIWKDERLVWNKTQYGGIEYIPLLQNQVWKPPLVLGNSNAHALISFLGSSEMHVMVNSNGILAWFPGGHFQTSCSPNIEKFPKDIQKCELWFNAWIQTINEIKFKIDKDTTDLKFYKENGIWELIGTSLTTSIHGVDHIHTQVIKVIFYLKRRASFYLINMILPIIVLGFLNLLVFFLPPQSGERMGFSVTVLLAMSVFLTIAADNLPKSSYPALSSLCVKLLVDICISSMVVLFTVIGLRFYHRKENNIPWCYAVTAKTILRRGKDGKISDVQETPIEPFEKGKGNDKSCINDGIDDSYDVKITWEDIGMTSDTIFFTISFIAIFCSHFIFFVRFWD